MKATPSASKRCANPTGYFGVAPACASRKLSSSRPAMPWLSRLATHSSQTGSAPALRKAASSSGENLMKVSFFLKSGMFLSSESA